MSDCRSVRSTLETLAATARAAWPPGTAAHVAACEACARALAAVRLARGLVTAAASGVEAPADFARRVMSAVDAAGRKEVTADPWRPAWLLLPVFGSVAAVLLAVFLQGPAATRVPRAWPGLVEPRSFAERLVFGPEALDADLVLAAVLEQGR